MDVNFLIGMAGLFVGAIGIVVAIYEGRKYRGPILSYQYDGANLIRSYDAVFPDTIEVTFGGKKVENLTHSQIVIWNHGRSPLRADDVSGSDPLLITFENDSSVLQAEVVKLTRPANKFKIEYHPMGKSVTFGFEFLDAGDGALVSVWHTSPKVKPSIFGTLMNKLAGPRSLGRFSGPRPNVPEPVEGGSLAKSIHIMMRSLIRKPYALSFLVMGMGIVAIVFGFFIGGYEIYLQYIAGGVGDVYIDPIGLDKLSGSVGLMIGGLIYVVVGAWTWSQVRRRFPKSLLPDEYEGSSSEDEGA